MLEYLPNFSFYDLSWSSFQITFIKLFVFLGEFFVIDVIYSLVRLVVQNTEELNFRPVFGSVKDPMAALGPYENLKPRKLVGIATAPTLFTASVKHHGSL